MPVSASEPDPVPLAGTWEEVHESRIQELRRKYEREDQAYGQGAKRRKGGGVPAAVRRAAAALSIAVLAYRPGAIGLVTVHCPYCGGRRSIQASSLRTWERQRVVPKCGASAKTGRPTCTPPEDNANG